MNEEITKDESIVDLSQMTREELEAYAQKQAKAYTDQRGLNDKLKSKIKEEPVVEEPKEEALVVEPAPVEDTKLSLDEQYEIASLSKDFSIDEIKEGKQFVGTAFGNTLSDVLYSTGFQAHIKTKREKSKSESMISDEPIVINTFESKAMFIKKMEANPDLLVEGTDDYNKYIQLKAEQEVAKGFK